MQHPPAVEVEVDAVAIVSRLGRSAAIRSLSNSAEAYALSQALDGYRKSQVGPPRLFARQPHRLPTPRRALGSWTARFSFPQDISMQKTPWVELLLGDPLSDIASQLADIVAEQFVVSNDIQHLARVSCEL